MLLVMLVILLMLCRIFEVIPSPACLMFLLSMLSPIFPESPDNPAPPPGKAKLPDNHGKDQVLGLPASPLTLISVWVAPPRILQLGTQKRANRANIFVEVSSVYSFTLFSASQLTLI